tara:strand:+ start:735 stop:1154 length:420 start_codon:yes stop_codon:yes gene_type:complete
MSKKKGFKMEDVPSDVAFVWIMSQSGTPIGIDMYNNTVMKYPEYFPEEHEHRRKMAASTSDEIESYQTELYKATSKLWDSKRAAIDGLPESETKDGMITMNGLEQALKNMDKASVISDRFDKREDIVRKKIYSKYFKSK